MIKTAPINETSTLYLSPESSITSADVEIGGVEGLENWNVTVLPVTGDVFAISFTPGMTGEFYLSVLDKVVAQIEVVSKTALQYLQDIEDEAIGSWRWDKTAGTLLLVRQDGTDLASFTVTDTLTEASRERL